MNMRWNVAYVYIAFGSKTIKIINIHGQNIEHGQMNGIRAYATNAHTRLHTSHVCEFDFFCLFAAFCILQCGEDISMHETINWRNTNAISLYFVCV